MIINDDNDNSNKQYLIMIRLTKNDSDNDKVANTIDNNNNVAIQLMNSITIMKRHLVTFS